MNYIVEYARLKNNEWVRPKYQVMSALSLKDLANRFYRMFDRNMNQIERVIWWENGNRQEVRKKETAHRRGPDTRQGKNLT